MAKKFWTTLAIVCGLFIITFHISAAKVAEEATYTAAEKAAIVQLRDSMSNELYEDYMHRDEYLILWLRAKNLNIDEAKELLQNNLKWRKTEKIDSLADEKFPQFESAYKTDLKTRDKDGRPAVLLNYGTWDIRKAALSGKLNELMRYATKVFFEAPSKLSRELGQANGSNHTQYYYISNLNGYNIRQQGCIRCLPFYIHYMQTYERYYPQHAKEKILINVPEIFTAIIDLSKPFWSSHLGKHLHFVGYDKNDWHKVFDKYISRDQLPIQFGGTSKRQI